MTTPVPRLWIPNGRQLTLQLVHQGQPAAVVLGGIDTGATGNFTTVATTWRDEFWNNFRALLTSNVTCTGAIMRSVSAPDGLVVEVGAPAAPAGTDTATHTVAAGSVLVKWSTATGGRSGKGRTFLPGLGAANINADGRTYATSFATRVTTAINAYLSSTALSGQSIDPAVLSFRKGFASPITGGALGTVIGVQRRRMRA